MNNFQKKILELIQKEGSQKALSESLGITANYVSMLAKGKRPLTEDLVEKIKKVYNIDFKDLIVEQSLQKLGFSTSIIEGNIKQINDWDLSDTERIKIENIMLKQRIQDIESLIAQYERTIRILEKVIENNVK